jgi:cytosine/adenosine deaminase-related metal-dependent hydrolase
LTLMVGRRAVLAGCAATMAIPARAVSPRDTLLRGADQVLTMAGAPIAKADVLVRDGRIVTVGAGLSASDAQVIDMAGHVVLPGLVDTHWHMWNTAARGLWRSGKGGFAPTTAALAKLFSPADAAIGVELALAEAVNAGITTVHNWAHNTRSPAHAEAELGAMIASGVRGRFAYGYPQDAARDRLMDLAHLATIARTEPSDLVSLGICARGPDRSDTAVWRAEWATARRLGLPISTHMASDAKAAALRGIAALAATDCLGPDVQLVHLTAASRADMDRVAQGGSPVSISPWTELEVGYGVPPIPDMIAAGLKIGLSVDNMMLAGSADLFSVMKLAADLARGVSRDQLVVADSDALGWATRIGAEGLGMAKSVGTIEPGKRADIIAVRFDALNLSPAADMASMLTHAARPENVALVMIDGVEHKRDGRLTRVDMPALQQRANVSIAQLRRSADV